MPWGLKRFQEAGCLHFVTFSCYQRSPRLGTPSARDVFEQTFEQARRWYGFYVAGYVVMPEHVHLLVSEPERAKLSLALQMLKQNVTRQLREAEGGPFWQARYYDFNVWSEAKRIEKLRYMHRNPVARVWSPARRIGRGAAFAITSPDWKGSWRSSCSGRHGKESGWESCRSFNVKIPRPVAESATRAGHPRELE